MCIEASYDAVLPTLQGVGERIAQRLVPKILILNGSHDRETSACRSHAGPLTAAGIVQVICDALNRRHLKDEAGLPNPPEAYVTAVITPEGGGIQVDHARLEEMGVRQAEGPRNAGHCG